MKKKHEKWIYIKDGNLHINKAGAKQAKKEHGEMSVLATILAAAYDAGSVGKKRKP